MFFSLYNKFLGINKLPFVEDIEVSCEDMHTVKLHVYDKTVSGCINYMGQYIYFDRDGVVLQSMQEKKERGSGGYRNPFCGICGWGGI